MEKIAYFDNAATTFPKPEEVYIAMDEFSRSCGVSLGRGQHKLSSKASYVADETRKLLLDMFHCTNKKVIFTNTETESINIILRGLVYPKGANIYISPFEHNAVTRTLNYLSKMNNINIIQLPVDKDSFQYDLEAIHQLFEERKPYAIVTSYVSNVIDGDLVGSPL